MTRRFLPEGRLLETEENKALCGTLQGLRQAMEENSTFRDGRMVWVSPAISAVLQIIEPKALPAAIAAEPSKAAVVETRISGRVVPRLTMVAPTTIYGMPSFLAIATAASTRRSPPRHIKTSPTTNNKTAFTIFLFLSSFAVIF